MKRLIPMLLLVAVVANAQEPTTPRRPRAAGTGGTDKPTPICLVDGVRVPSEACFGVDALSKNQIDRVEVLKGAAAAAQYGPDAANGVVLIYTKDGSKPGGDPLAGLLYPPELVMKNQNAISLTDKQKQAIQGYIVEAQGKFVPTQLKLGGEVEKLQALLKAPSTDEDRAVEQINRVLDLEREVKQAQVRLMVRVKNALTAAQQAELNKLREDR